MFDRRILLFLLISMAVHFVAVTIVHRKNLPNPKSEEITIEIVESQDSPNNKGQIVEQNEEALNDVVPEKTKYLSQHNQKVVEETKALNTGKFNNKLSGSEQESATKKPEPPDEFGTRPKKDLLAKLTPGYKWPNAGPVSQASSDDYLKDVKDGVQTLLSTREFIYFTYYKRIKGQLAQYWEPKIKDKVMKLIHQGRNIASSGDKITRLIITLDGKGILTKVQVLGASGVKDLDDAAIEAFRAAAPFPNPPKGIIEQDGNIRITWDFVLEV